MYTGLTNSDSMKEEKKKEVKKMLNDLQIRIIVIAVSLILLILVYNCVQLCREYKNDGGWSRDTNNTDIERAEEGVVRRSYFGFTTVRAYFASRASSVGMESQVYSPASGSGMYAERVDSELEPDARRSNVPIADQL